MLMVPALFDEAEPIEEFQDADGNLAPIAE
jgi:hypothetical protein